jgi:hypothetical protein
MSGQPWSRHFQNWWEERAADRRNPAWLRVTSLAYAKHRRNGHAPFKPGALGLILGAPPDSINGEPCPMDKSNVQRAIKTAIDHGWLAEGSGSTCLIVPAHGITGGGQGHENEQCQRHTRKHR